jgi:hypothetical protein
MVFLFSILLDKSASNPTNKLIKHTKWYLPCWTGKERLKKDQKNPKYFLWQESDAKKSTTEGYER